MTLSEMSTKLPFLRWRCNKTLHVFNYINLFLEIMLFCQKRAWQKWMVSHGPQISQTGHLQLVSTFENHILRLCKKWYVRGRSGIWACLTLQSWQKSLNFPTKVRNQQYFALLLVLIGFQQYTSDLFIFFPKKGSVLSNITLILHSILPNQRSGMQNIPSKPSVSPETACQERKLTGCPLSPRGPCGPMGPVSPWNEEKYSGEWEIPDREASKTSFKNIPIKLHCLCIREKQH